MGRYLYNIGAVLYCRGLECGQCSAKFVEKTLNRALGFSVRCWTCVNKRVVVLHSYVRLHKTFNGLPCTDCYLI